MTRKRRNGRTAGFVIAAALAAPLLMAAPAGAADARGRVDDHARDGLRASAVGAAVTNSPYDTRTTLCPQSQTILITKPYVTLFAYGADGGANSIGVKGGAGAVAVGSFELPFGNWIDSSVGCKGGSASPDNWDATDPGSSWHGSGGGGGWGIVDGEAGGAGGGSAGWYFHDVQLLIGGAGGGAGGAAAQMGGGAGGDAGHAGADVPNGATGGGGGAVGVRGAGGLPGGKVARGPIGGGNGASAADVVGAGGGGMGSFGGGGGGGGSHSLLTPSAGGGGGGSDVVTAAGYWAMAGGVGHGEGRDGLAVMVTVRDIVRASSWPGNVVRGVANNGTRGGGYILNMSGAIATFSQGVNPSVASGGPSWPGQDMARGIAVLPDRSGGYVVDRHGTLFPFKLGNHPMPPKVTKRVLWPGKDIARGMTILPDGSGGYVQGRDGRLYPFAIGNHGKPPEATRVPTWPGRDMARGITSPFMDAGRIAGGWVADAQGRLRPWGRLLGAPTPPAIGPTVAARGIASFAGGAGGVLVDGSGKLSTFASPGAP